MELNDLKTKLDSSDMYSQINRFTSVFGKAFNEGLRFQLPSQFKQAGQILGLGMGGSGMAYKLLKSLSQALGGVPLEIISDYDLPKNPDQSAVVFATSFSGNTEETLSATRQAFEQKKPLVCLTTGGKLADFAQENGLPLFQFSYPVAPRVGLPYTFGAALGMFISSGLLNISVGQIEESLTEVNNLIPDWQLTNRDNNRATELARSLHHHQVFVVGGGVMEAAAIRWKGQMNENAKTVSFTEPMPEMCHNMILGFQHPADVCHLSSTVFLTSSFDHPRYARRYQIIDSLLRQSGSTTYTVPSAGKLSLFSSLLAQIILGDYVSYYLALLNGVDPVEMDRISDLKKQLSIKEKK